MMPHNNDIALTHAKGCLRRNGFKIAPSATPRHRTYTMSVCLTEQDFIENERSMREICNELLGPMIELLLLPVVGAVWKTIRALRVEIHKDLGTIKIEYIAEL